MHCDQRIAIYTGTRFRDIGFLEHIIRTREVEFSRRMRVHSSALNLGKQYIVPVDEAPTPGVPYQWCRGLITGDAESMCHDAIGSIRTFGF
jgi:hypothetical protein